jgi:hypothetical protein
MAAWIGIQEKERSDSCEWRASPECGTMAERRGVMVSVEYMVRESWDLGRVAMTPARLARCEDVGTDGEEGRAVARVHH